jgi:hypothetical protein
LIRQNNVTCTLQLIEHRIDPGKKFTASSPNLDLVYVASHAGTSNATVTFPYLIKNSENKSNNNAVVSKQFFFTIYNRTKVPTMSQSGQQALIDIATNLPGLQEWSHDWQFLSMGYMTAKNQPGMWQYATVNLRAPSTSSKIPCDHGGWDAMVTIDMKTLKVISAWYPTIESHNCDNIATGGGPTSHGGFLTNTSSSPLKQFKSGISTMDIKCSVGYVLTIKSEDDSPACVRPLTVKILSEKGWSKFESTQSNHSDNSKTNLFGIVGLMYYHGSGPCGVGTCPLNTFNLKMNSNYTAYLLGYNICDGDSCIIRNDLVTLLPLNVIGTPNYKFIALPENPQWKYGDVFHIQVEVSSIPDNKTAIWADLGNSTIIH